MSGITPSSPNQKNKGRSVLMPGGTLAGYTLTGPPFCGEGAVVLRGFATVVFFATRPECRAGVPCKFGDTTNAVTPAYTNDVIG